MTSATEMIFVAVLENDASVTDEQQTDGLAVLSRRSPHPLPGFLLAACLLRDFSFYAQKHAGVRKLTWRIALKNSGLQQCAACCSATGWFRNRAACRATLTECGQAPVPPSGTMPSRGSPDGPVSE